MVEFPPPNVLPRKIVSSLMSESKKRSFETKGRCINCGCYDSPGTTASLDGRWATCGTCKVTTLAKEWFGGSVIVD